MTQAKDKGVEGQDGRRPSGATRRIVVENLPPEEPPRAQGRRLATPPDISSTRARAWDEDLGVGTPASSLGQRQGSQPARQRSSAPASHSTARHLKSAAGVGGKESVNVRRLLVIVGGMLAVAFVGSVALLLMLGDGKKKSSVKAAASPSPASQASAPSPVEVVATSPLASVETSPGGLVPTPNTPQDVIPSTMATAEVRSMTEQLAAQISQKTGYAFAPEFVELIRAHTQEYNSPRAMVGARLYRREINKSFRDEGMNPLVGYALAMSRSRFDPNTTEKGIGIWQMPPSVARSQGYLGAGENTSRLKVPETSAQISAAYTKALLSTFDAEDFMYAIACFGMSLQEAGRVQAHLVSVAPDAKSRRDIMKIIRAGVLNADQVDSIARFFAAGVVGENPQKFGLDDSQPFSSLY